MSPAPTYADWKALRTAILALIAAGVTGQAKAFLKAVRETKAAAVVLLFALARSLWPQDEAQTETEWKPYKPPGLSRLGGLRPDRAEDAWRNPSVRAYASAPRTTIPPQPGPVNPHRLEKRVTRAFDVLRAMLDLCDDPERHAARLKRRLDRADVDLAAAEVKAFAVNARAKARRTHEARRLIDRTWRSRRRRESG